jgi:lectin, mannose-binding 2
MPLKMPAVSFLGFSAETGELSDNFDIISVDAKNMYSAATGSGSSGGPGSRQESNRHQAGRRQSPLEPKSGSGGGWGWFFFKIVIFFALVTGGYVGWTMYRTNRRSRF